MEIECFYLIRRFFEFAAWIWCYWHNYYTIGGENQGLRIAAATYLKNLTRRNIDSNASCTNINKEFKDQLMQVLLQAEPSVLKVLLEAVCIWQMSISWVFNFLLVMLTYLSKLFLVCCQFRVIVGVEFVKQNSWPELVHELQSAIQSSYLISKDANSGCTTVNGLMVLHALIKPFQVFVCSHVLLDICLFLQGWKVVGA